MIYHLYSLDNDNKIYNNRLISNSYETFTSKGLNKLLILRNADIFIPEYLELNFIDGYNDNYLDIIKQQILYMKISCSKILQLPLNLLLNLNEPIICDDKLYINLSFNMFFGDIKLIGLQFVDTLFYFSSNELEQYITNYSIIGTTIFLNNFERQQIVSKHHEEIIQTVSFIDVMKNKENHYETTNIFELNLPFKGTSKGFFIMSDNIKNLKDMKLFFNNEIRFNLNRFLINSKCKKISDKMIFLPFNYSQSYLERTSESFEGSANLSFEGLEFIDKLESITLHLEFDTPINNVKIYNLIGNIYQQNSGCGKLLYKNDIDNYNYDLTLQNLEVINNDLETINPILTYVYNEPIYKPITNNKKMCLKSNEIIGFNEKYMSCSKCENNFKENHIKKSLETSNKCPICDNEWSNFDIYINLIDLEPYNIVIPNE